MVEKSWVERSGVEKSGVEMTFNQKSMVDIQMGFNIQEREMIVRVR